MLDINAVERVLDKRSKRGATDETLIQWLEGLKEGPWKRRAKFKVGDKVNYINESGINFGWRVIAKIINWYGDDFRYYIVPTDTPWFPVAESCLNEIDKGTEKAL